MVALRAGKLNEETASKEHPGCAYTRKRRFPMQNRARINQSTEGGREIHSPGGGQKDEVGRGKGKGQSFRQKGYVHTGPKPHKSAGLMQRGRGAVSIPKMEGRRVRVKQ